MSFQALLDEVWPQPPEAARESLRAYALVDNAGCGDLLTHLRSYPSLRWISLFEGTREANAIEVAPILIDLGRVGQNGYGARPLLAWLAESCRTTNALLLMHSHWTHQPLAAALRLRLDAFLPDDMAVLLRYFDTRIFASLLRVLDVEQRTHFCAVATRWWWLDRAGLPRSHRSEERATDPLPKPIEFNAAQQAQLIDACEADAVVYELLKVASDLSRGRTRAELHALASHCLRRAETHGITGFPMQVMFCVIALERGVRFDEQAPWADALAQAKREGRDLKWVIGAVGA